MNDDEKIFLDWYFLFNFASGFSISLQQDYFKKRNNLNAVGEKK